jgi:predicted secreted protein
VRRTGAWCNGSTPAFGAVDLGSSPGAPANSRERGAYFSKQASQIAVSLFYFVEHAKYLSTNITAQG